MRTISQMWKEIYESKPAFNADTELHALYKRRVEVAVTRSSNMLYDSRRAPNIYTLNFILSHVNFWLSCDKLSNYYFR